MSDIDLSFRPDTYWPESLTPEQLLTRLRNTTAPVATSNR